MPTIAHQFDIRQPQPWISKLTNNTGYTINSKSLVGIEVEVENAAHIARVNDIWAIKGDGSLRNGGVEFVTRPILASDAPAALAHLMDLLKADACFSPRTSVHVHVDYTECQPEDVFNTVLLYSIFERVLYRFCGKQRIKNIFCVPITETNLLMHYAAQGLKPGRWCKYTGLNIKTLENYGTIEYRHMAGTPDVQKLCLWIDMITHLKEYCLKEGTKSIRAQVAGLHDDSDFTTLLKTVFGPAADALKFEDNKEVLSSYKVAKQLLSKPTTTISLIQREHSGASPIYKVKGN